MSEVVKAPQGYICPITCDLMVNPVIDSDGNSYEEAAITEWLKSSKLSPITRHPLDASKLVPNRALQEAIEAFKIKNPSYGLPTGLMPPSPPATATDASASASTGDTLSVKVLRNAENILVSIKAAAEREPTTQTSSDICCVVDTSGSMGSDVQLKSASGINESFGINILDLVKHAMKTIVECLTDRDRLSLVDFNFNARVIFDLTVMDAQGKIFAKKKIDEMDPNGGTNLYDGLIKGLDVLCAESSRNRNSSLFLLTDGVASTEPPKGTIPMLRRYIDEKAQGNLSCTINTFGFGYDLDTDLLQSLAFEGNGAFAFIPDGSFVGTIFINALSNFLSTVAKDVTLSVENTDANAVLNTELTKHCKYEVTSWGILYRFGSVSYGQSKDLLIGYSTPDATSTPTVECSLAYTGVISNTKAELKGVPCSNDLGDADGDAAVLFELHKARFTVVNMVYKAIADLKLRRENSLRSYLQDTIALLSEINGRLPSGPAGKRSREVLSALLEDVTGQVSMALVDRGAFNKWGKHFLPSLARAHLGQMCNNFKDPGVQMYGGVLFDSLRDRLHDVFCALPPPKPSNNYGARGAYGHGGGGSSRAPLNMSSFANSAGACFHENCLITLCRGGNSGQTYTKPVSTVTRGDFVLTEGGAAIRVLFVLETMCPDGLMAAVSFPKSGLRLTHYHPMKADGQWTFPRDLNPKVEALPCRAVYSFVLADPAAYSVHINGTWCASFGHTFAERSVNCTPSEDNRELLCHSYFGDRKRVVSDMEAIITQQQMLTVTTGGEHLQSMGGALRRVGVASILPECIVRDEDSSVIVGIKPPGMDTETDPAVPNPGIETDSSSMITVCQ